MDRNVGGADRLGRTDEPLAPPQPGPTTSSSDWGGSRSVGAGSSGSGE